MRSVDLEALARCLAARLNSALPSQTHVEARGRELEFLGFDGSYGYLELDLGSFSPLDRGEWAGLEFLVEHVLSDVQDSVAHATRGQAWPRSPGYPSEPLPDGWAEVRTEALHFGYPRSDVRFEPIPLQEIVRGSSG